MLLMLVVNSMQRCSHPQAEEGHQVREGCLLRICKSNTWRSSLVFNKCCYDKEAYAINTTISSNMSKDGCVKAALNCVEETSGIAKTVLSVKNYCEDYATKDQLEEIKEILVEQIEAGSGCQGMEAKGMEANDDKEEHKVLLIGPGGNSNGKSEVLSLPDLTPLDCNVPLSIQKDSRYGGDYHRYVGRSTSTGVITCGGEINYDEISSCYLLTSSGYQEMPGLINKRTYAASVVTPLGLWVTGGYYYGQVHDTTEIWSNNGSQPHVRLPEAMAGHCLTSLNKTHALLTGGGYPSERSFAAFIYNEEEGFTRIEDMKTARWFHGCTVINDSTALVAGGSSDHGPLSSTEYLDLTSLTWSPGPELPEEVTHAQMLGPEELGPEMGGHLLIGGYDLFKLVEEGLEQKRHWTYIEKPYWGRGAHGGAFVVNKNLFC